MNNDRLASSFGDVRRLHQILGVFAKFGLAGWLGNVNSASLQKHLRSIDHGLVQERSEGERLRLAFAELGTTFVKLGQILSTRPDLVGPEISSELSELQSGTPADEPEVVLQTIEAELGAPPAVLFLEFDEVALASASIGQAHLAKLRDGTEVVVKVQHPGIERQIQSDLSILRKLAGLAERHSQEARRYRPIQTIEEFSRTLEDELDFLREKRNLERFYTNFECDDFAIVPRPFGDLSSRRVLTMERLQGTSLADADRLVEQGQDLEILAQTGAEIFLQMIFRDRFYHADPHPGNLLAMQESAIGILDCGMVGVIDEQLGEQFEDLVLSMNSRDSQALCDVICDIGSMPNDLDRRELRREVEGFLMEFGNQKLDDFDVGGALIRMMEIIRRFNIVMPSRITLLVKVLIMLEGTARELSPAFSLADMLKPYQSRIVEQRLSPRRVMQKAQRNLSGWARLAEIAPRELVEILQQIKKGSFNVHLEHRKLDSITNRLVLGILSAAMLVSASLLLSFEVPPMVNGVSLMGGLGAGVALGIAAILVRAIWRSGRL